MGGNVGKGDYGVGHGNFDGDENGNRSAPVSPRKWVDERFETPILSRQQRMGLLNPPFLGDVHGDVDGERDLTSSVGKGRAAVDGLLSLHRMAN